MSDSKVTAQTLQRRFGDVRRTAHRQPVTVTHHGRDDLVVMSSDHYEQLLRYAPRAWYASELPAHLLALLETQPAAGEGAGGAVAKKKKGASVERKRSRSNGA